MQHERFCVSVAIAAVCLISYASTQHVEPGQDVYCSLPEVGNAGATGSISVKPSIFLQNFQEVCTECAHSPFRSADGTCNNVANLGSANRPPRRLLPPAYDDGVNSPRTLGVGGYPLPAATNVSRTVHPDEDGFQDFTVMLMQWGQFIDHDITSFPIISTIDTTVLCCGGNGTELPFLPNKECFPILLTPEDRNVRFVGSCMEFARSVPARDVAGNRLIPREQVNAATAFLDASTVYGSTQELQTLLRQATPNDTGYLLATSANDLLPHDPEAFCIARQGDFCFLAGDRNRVNEQPLLVVIHTTWVRLHNRIASELKLLRPNHTNEELFQLTRKIVIGIMQNIHFKEWLPYILGHSAMREYGLLTGSRIAYIPSVDPRITNIFSTAAFRFGHMLIPDFFNISGSAEPLRKLFNRPDLVFDNFNGALLALASPLRTNDAQKSNRFMSSEVTGHLFEPDNQEPNAPSRGLDLVAMNIQRGRDHGLQPYNEYRKFCGLPPLRSFADLPAEVASVMAQVYRSVDDIDAFSGFMSEERVAGGLVGPTLACIIGNQFHALKYGDRFYFETNRMPEGFTDEQLAEIRRMTQAHVFCQENAVSMIQKNAFMVPHTLTNPLLNCTLLRADFIDLTLW